MLSELHIRNFRLFEELYLKGLGQVNLFAGKNNTGKTALLEALRIYAAQGEDTVVNHILKQRGEFTPSWASSYDALFNRRLLREDKEKQDLQINDLVIYRKKGSNDDVEYRVEGLKGPNSKLKANVTPDHPRDQVVFVPFMTNGFQLEPLWDEIVLTELEEEVLRILRQTVEPV